MNNLGISIILPVLNEAENLKYLIPRISQKINSLKLHYEILVVDDNSTDNTKEILEELVHSNINVYHILRTKENSLPNSIFDGVKHSNFENVMWLDADGSMDENAVEKLLIKFIDNNTKVFIGSRFVSGGGYKGNKDSEKKNFIKSFLNVFNSEDSNLAILLSIIFNKILDSLLMVKVKDLTSGFIVGKKSYFEEEMFKNYIYGEYFISVIVNLYINKIEIEEVGYYCLVRKFGESKSSNSILNMVLLSKPYILTAVQMRRKLNENS